MDHHVSFCGDLRTRMAPDEPSDLNGMVYLSKRKKPFCRCRSYDGCTLSLGSAVALKARPQRKRILVIGFEQMALAFGHGLPAPLTAPPL